jgi:hypothetical protein
MWKTLLQLATVPWNDTRDSILVLLKHGALTVMVIRVCNGHEQMQKTETVGRDA